jgi:two-component system response regulator DesR
MQTTDVGPSRVDDREPVRVLLADLEGVARHALSGLLHGLEGVTLVAEAGTRQAIADAMRSHRPDVVVIDDRLLLPSGGHVLAGLGPLWSKVRVIVVGVDDDPAYAARAHRLGADAWIAKERAADELPLLLGVT